MSSMKNDTTNSFNSMKNINNQYETVTFVDAMEVENTIEHSPDKTFSKIPDMMGLGDFLSRPVLLTTQTWSPLVPNFNYTFNPWNLFLVNKRISNRISNFNIMHMNLNVKFMLNGNVFYFGRLLVDYTPLDTFDDITQNTSFNQEDIVLACQRLNIRLDPNTSMGGTLKLPYLLQTDFGLIPEGTLAFNGSINIRTINDLKHANGAEDPINISIYAWASEVTMAIPTSINSAGIVAQSGEYTKPVISTVASNVANAAGKLSTIPYVAPYAKATQYISSVISDVAKIFGYSRPANLNEYSTMIPKYISNLANTDAMDNVNKLSVDSKQELSVDTRITGLAGKDELIISDIASKECFLFKFTWLQSYAANKKLAWVKVRPQVYDHNVDAFYFPACAFVTNPFTYWRSDMTYRIEVVCTQFHRGRLQIVYDPGTVTSLEANVLQTQIIDLASEKDFTFKIGWAGDRSFMKTITPVSTDLGWTAGDFANPLVARETTNGIFSVYVLNELTAPDASIDNSIEINVYVSCDNLQVAVPTDKHYKDLTYRDRDYVAQSNEQVFENDHGSCAMPSQNNDITIVNAPSKDEDHIYDVYFGEKIVSFRNLLKRYNLSESYTVNTLPQKGFIKIATSNAPCPPGTWTGSFYSGGFNRTYNTLFNYLSPAYLQIRGGTRIKYIVESGVQAPRLAGVERSSERISDFTTVDYTDLNISVSSQSVYMDLIHDLNISGMAGATVTVAEHQPILEPEFPYYSNLRFDCAKSLNCSNTNTYCFYSHAHNLYFTTTTENVMVHKYCATAEDFNLSLYQGPGPMVARLT